MRLNKTVVLPAVFTHEGAVGAHINREQELRRTVLACMLWEDTFYEDGVSVANRIADLVAQVPASKVAEIAIEARTKMNLRHVPLLLCRELARLGTLRGDTLSAVIQRPDEMTEFLAIYWAGGKQPLAAQVKKGLAQAFRKFTSYALAKYNQDKAVELRDVLFLSHAKPRDSEQAAIWKELVDGTLPVPNTWEVALSSGEDKKSTFTRLITEGKLGALALLRNLRNMEQAGVEASVVKGALQTAEVGRVLPFRFFTAAKHAPNYEPELDALFLRSCAQMPKLQGKTLIVVDVSGSMYGGSVSRKSEVNRAHAASALAAIAREMCEDARVYATAGSDYTRVHATAQVPARRGMALVDAIYGQSAPLGGGGIFLKPVVEWLQTREVSADRIIVLTDEQDCAIDAKDKPTLATPFGKYNYLINVASYKNGIGYGRWTHIDGFSEATLGYIAALESTPD